MKRLCLKLINQILNLCYPRICLHCKMPIATQAILFCSSCSIDFFLYEKELISQDQICLALFEKKGAVKTLEKALRKPNQLFLAKHLGYFYFVLWEKQSWPPPSVILSFKESPFYKRDCPKKMLAKTLAKLMKVPYLTKKKQQLPLKGKIVLLIELNINEKDWADRVELCVKNGANRVYGLCLTSS